MKNWFRSDMAWQPIAQIPAKGPFVLTDETKTIQWFSEKPSKAAVDHAEHEQDEGSLQFLYDEKGKPQMKQRKVKPAYWVFAQVVG